MTDKPKVGDMAPQFSLRAQDGKTVSLGDFRGLKNVVVYFYPKDFTMGCTAETKTFGSAHQEIQGLDGEVIGISSDSVESHSSFASECGAGFPMLSDPGGKVRESYGASGRFGILPARVTFVVDKAGVVRHVFSSQTSPTRHVSEAVGALRRMQEK